MGPSARDKGRDAVGQPLLRGPEGLRCTFSKPIGEGLRKCVHTERGKKHIRKIHTKKEGVPLGNPLEKGTKIIPCMSRIQTSLVEVRDILVWELGQTCEAAGNGTRIIPLKHSQDLLLIMLQILKKLSLQEKMPQEIKHITFRTI